MVVALSMIGDRLGLPLFLLVGGGLLAWYIAGNEIMRRRGRRLALWCKRAVDPLGGRQAIKWLTLHSFRLELDSLKAPFHSGAITGLAESWDVPMIWLWNRLRGRRDMALFELTLRQQPIWSLELCRPHTLLAGDARRLADREGWRVEPLDEFFVAPAEGAPRELACRLLADLGATRADLVRLAVRRQGARLTLALNVPDPARFPPADCQRLLQQLARTAMQFTTPG